MINKDWNHKTMTELGTTYGYQQSMWCAQLMSLLIVLEEIQCSCHFRHWDNLATQLLSSILKVMFFIKTFIVAVSWHCTERVLGLGALCSSGVALIIWYVHRGRKGGSNVGGFHKPMSQSWTRSRAQLVQPQILMFQMSGCTCWVCRVAAIT